LYVVVVVVAAAVNDDDAPPEMELITIDANTKTHLGHANAVCCSPFPVPHPPISREPNGMRAVTRRCQHAITFPSQSCAFFFFFFFFFFVAYDIRSRKSISVLRYCTLHNATQRNVTTI